MNVKAAEFEIGVGIKSVIFGVAAYVSLITYCIYDSTKPVRQTSTIITKGIQKMNKDNSTDTHRNLGSMVYINIGRGLVCRAKLIGKTTTVKYSGDPFYPVGDTEYMFNVEQETGAEGQRQSIVVYPHEVYSTANEAMESNAVSKARCTL